MEKKRSPGISTFGNLFILSGVLVTLYAFLGAGLLVDKLTGISRIINMVYGPALLITGIGLLMLKEWARIMAILISIIITIILIIQNLPQLLQNNDTTGIVLMIFVFLLFVSPLIFFINSKVREQFK